MSDADTRARTVRLTLICAAALFSILGIWFRVMGFHLRPTTIGPGLVSNDIYVEITQARALLKGDLKAIHDERYGANLAIYRNTGWSFDGVPATALLSMPFVAAGDAFGWSEETVWGAAGIPFILCVPLAAWAVLRWGGGAAGPRAPDVTLVAVALMLAPLAFQVGIFEARPYYLFAIFNVLAVVTLPRSITWSAVWMALAYVTKSTSALTAVVLGLFLFIDGLRTGRVRDAIRWGLMTVAGIVIGYLPFLMVNGRRVIANIRDFSGIVPITPGSLTWQILQLRGATQIDAPLHKVLQVWWTPVLLVGLTLLCALVIKRTRVRYETAALLALVGGAHALLIATSKVVQFRYGVMPIVIAAAWGVQAGVPNGWRWALGFIIVQTFVLTAVPIEWKVQVWCFYNAGLGIALWSAGLRSETQPTEAAT